MAAPAGGPLRDALDHKDASQVASLAGAAGPLLTELMLATGGADRCLATLAALELPATARALIERIGHVLAAVRTAKPDLAVTVDPVENRGFEYYIGTCFSLFRSGVRGELGRGGRYLVAGNQAEPAFGFTLYMETLRRALPPPFMTPPASLRSRAPAGAVVVRWRPQRRRPPSDRHRPRSS